MPEVQCQMPKRGNGHGLRSAFGTGHWTSAAQRGFTFVELLVVTTILVILASAVMPLARVSIQRQREAELRRDLREMRTPIAKFNAAPDSLPIACSAIHSGHTVSH